MEPIGTAAQDLGSQVAEDQALRLGFRNLLKALGEDPDREGLRNTPHRVVKMFREITDRPKFNLTVFDADGYSQMITSGGIQFYTLCEHHLVPFFGTVTIGYIPQGSIVGISKLARVVDHFSRGLNTQEYFTQNIANLLWKELDPKGLGVFVRGRHLCQEMRGIKRKAIMSTNSLKGLMLDDMKAREEFMRAAYENGNCS